MGERPTYIRIMKTIKNAQFKNDMDFSKALCYGIIQQKFLLRHERNEMDDDTSDEAYDYFKKVTDSAHDTLANDDVQGCELGHASSCLSAGLLDSAKVNKLYPRKVAPDPAMAVKFYKYG